MVTPSDACLQTLLAVTVQMTSVPGTTFPASTSTLVFSPLSLTASFSTCAVVLSSMQPSACAKACDANVQAMAAAMNFLNMCVSFTAESFRSVDGHGELDRLRSTRGGNGSEQHAHARARGGRKFAGV